MGRRRRRATSARERRGVRFDAGVFDAGPDDRDVPQPVEAVHGQLRLHGPVRLQRAHLDRPVHKLDVLREPVVPRLFRRVRLDDSKPPAAGGRHALALGEGVDRLPLARRLPDLLHDRRGEARRLLRRHGRRDHKRRHRPLEHDHRRRLLDAARPVHGGRAARAGGHLVRHGQEHRLRARRLDAVGLLRRQHAALLPHDQRAAPRPFHEAQRLLVRVRALLPHDLGHLDAHARPLHGQGGAPPPLLSRRGEEGLALRHHAADLVGHRAALARKLRRRLSDAARAARAEALPHVQAGAHARLLRLAQQDCRGRG
mmetsp:Transcript_26401/g.45154  ORF Transcript_26401/g.45154 Transcript_26401/m.45154 type:complete len:313 (+) Transcript_26401:356-1294(+)